LEDCISIEKSTTCSLINLSRKRKLERKRWCHVVDAIMDDDKQWKRRDLWNKNLKKQEY
jgi:hypothetical protein